MNQTQVKKNNELLLHTRQTSHDPSQGTHNPLGHQFNSETNRTTQLQLSTKRASYTSPTRRQSSSSPPKTSPHTKLSPSTRRQSRSPSPRRRIREIWHPDSPTVGDQMCTNAISQVVPRGPSPMRLLSSHTYSGPEAWNLTMPNAGKTTCTQRSPQSRALSRSPSPNWVQSKRGINSTTIMTKSPTMLNPSKPKNRVTSARASPAHHENLYCGDDDRLFSFPEYDTSKVYIDESNGGPFEEKLEFSRLAMSEEHHITKESTTYPDAATLPTAFSCLRPTSPCILTRRQQTNNASNLTTTCKDIDRSEVYELNDLDLEPTLMKSPCALFSGQTT